MVNVGLNAGRVGGELKPTCPYQKSPWSGSAPRSNDWVVAFSVKFAVPVVVSGVTNPSVAGGGLRVVTAHA